MFYYYGMNNTALLKKYLFLGLVLTSLASVSPTFAIDEEPDAKEPDTPRLNLFLQESDYLTGNWGGLRNRLEERGVDIYGAFVMSPMVLSKGQDGARKAKGTYRNILILGTQIDTEKLGLYKGGTFVMEYMAGNVGTNPSEYLGSYSEIDCLAPEKNVSTISQLYYEHSFKDDLFSLKVGKQNTNEDFHHRENSELFLNHSYHVAPNIPMPDCLTSQMGARAKLRVAEDVYLQAGIYDGNIREGATPKGFFTGENGYVTFLETHYLSDFKGHEGKYMLGGWLHSAVRGEGFENFKNDGAKKYNYGGYFAFEQKLFHTLGDHSGGLSLLGQLSLAPNDINEIPCYCSVGLVWSGVGERRKGDKIGVALAWHQYSSIMKELENKTSEKVVELFYKFKVTNFLSIKPGMQYVMRPSGNGAGAFALGVRTVLLF